MALLTSQLMYLFDAPSRCTRNASLAYEIEAVSESDAVLPLSLITFSYYIEIDECLHNPCQHGGLCTNLLAGYKCNCTIGYSGEDCQIGR